MTNSNRRRAQEMTMLRFLAATGLALVMVPAASVSASAQLVAIQAETLRPVQTSGQGAVRVTVSAPAAPIVVLPDATRTPLRLAKEGSILNVLASEGEWYLVEWDDSQWGRRVGYIEKRHVSVQIAAPQQEVALSADESRSPVPAAETAAGWSAFANDPHSVAAQAAQRVAYDLTAMYKAVNPSIVKIHSDFGTGSGFLIREDGLIATNHHVVRNSRYLAVEFPDGRKVTTDVVTLDPKHDLAILKVNRSVTSGLRPLRLLPADRDEQVKAGIPVVAFGSPLSQTFLMTQGIVSKVEPTVLLGDFLIQAGNSGGPLVNLEGDVIGINTFAERQTSGAIRVNLLREVMAGSDLAAGSLSEPSDKQLPAASRVRYPTDLLKSKVVTEPFDVSAYRLDGGKFTVTALTPVLLAKASVRDDIQQAANRYARRAKKIKDEKFDPVDEPFYDWVRNATEYLDPVVTFQITPDFGQTKGSAFMSALNGMSASMNHTVAAPTRQTLEFKAEFLDFKLYRDGELVEPVTPGRAITGQSVESTYVSFVDEAYNGMYSYAPEVFLSGSLWRLDIFDARDPERVHKSITLTPASRVITQIRQDFGEVAAPQIVPRAPLRHIR